MLSECQLELCSIVVTKWHPCSTTEQLVSLIVMLLLKLLYLDIFCLLLESSVRQRVVNVLRVKYKTLEEAEMNFDLSIDAIL